MVVPADGAMVILLFVSIGFVGRRQYRVRAMTRLLLFASYAPSIQFPVSSTDGALNWLAVILSTTKLRFMFYYLLQEEEEEDHGGRGATGERARRTLVVSHPTPELVQSPRTPKFFQVNLIADCCYSDCGLVRQGKQNNPSSTCSLAQDPQLK